MPYRLKAENRNLWVPKTPYNEEEIRGDYLTNKSERIAVYTHHKTAIKRQKQLEPIYRFNLIIEEINEKI